VCSMTRRLGSSAAIITQSPHCLCQCQCDVGNVTLHAHIPPCQACDCSRGRAWQPPHPILGATQSSPAQAFSSRVSYRARSVLLVLAFSAGACSICARQSSFAICSHAPHCNTIPSPFPISAVRCNINAALPTQSPMKIKKNECRAAAACDLCAHSTHHANDRSTASRIACSHARCRSERSAKSRYAGVGFGSN
jgi:hypothetical protein